MKKTSSKSTLSSLPQEIAADIFLRLPVNSILSCRCVCKIWRTLICSPNFIKYHLNHTIQNNSNLKLMFKDDLWNGKTIWSEAYSIGYASISSYSLSLDSCGCDGGVRMYYPFEYRKGNHIDILGSCNGLICMGISSDYDYAKNSFKENSICVWNPTTREYKKIQVPVRDFDLYSTNPCSVRYGFGYDCIINDYKVVRISGYENSYCSKIEVCPLRSSTWNCTEIKPYKFSDQRRSRGLLFNGALHWLGVAITQETSSEVIISFDISNERIIDVPLPEETILNRGNKKAKKILGMWRDCLCLVLIVPGTRADIWVMQELGVRESWTKEFTFSQQIVSKYSYLKPIWTLQNGEILIDLGYDLLLFYPSNGAERIVCFKERKAVRQQVIYTDSLVSLNTGTYVEMSRAKIR